MAQGNNSRKNSGLWIVIGVFFAALIGGLLFSMMGNPDTKAYKSCQTVDDYRIYISEYGHRGRHYAEAQKFVDAYVADSLAQAKVEAEKIEDAIYNSITTLADCDNYLSTYPNGRYVTAVMAKRSNLEAIEKEEAAYRNCTTIAGCNNYLKDYPNGTYVTEVKAKKAELEKKKAQQSSFSVSSGRKVIFATGNLQYQPSSRKWRIAPNPWDCAGSSNADISSTYSGWIDMFGWGTGNNPTKATTNNADYSNFTDWGSKYGSGWRTLSQSEWRYVFEQRYTNSGIRYAKATVNGVKGLILVPDNWSRSTYSLNGTNDSGAGFSSNNISASTWKSTFAPAGAVFLPAAGYREGTSFSDNNNIGYYVTSTPYQSDYTYTIFLGNSIFDSDTWGHRYRGRSVRLVKAAY